MQVVEVFNVHQFLAYIKFNKLLDNYEIFEEALSSCYSFFILFFVVTRAVIGIMKFTFPIRKFRFIDKTKTEHHLTLHLLSVSDS